MGEFFHNGSGHIVLLKNKHIYTHTSMYIFTKKCSSCYLYANGRDGEYGKTACLLSKTVHSFTHETRVKLRAKEGGEVQATLRDMWAA